MLLYMIVKHVENTVNYDIIIITKAPLYTVFAPTILRLNSMGLFDCSNIVGAK
jgi:hypothetical protein